MWHPLKHFKTITKHRHQVIKNCFRAGIGAQGLKHDLSKYSPTEFLSGAKYYDGTRSPNEIERRDIGYSKAWLHHKGRNRHHFEYWCDYNPAEKRVMPVKMPLNYVIEMFCDRVAASKIYMKDGYTEQKVLDYFEKGKSSRQIHPETSDLLENLLVMLARDGEEKTFHYIKKELSHKKEY